MRAFVLCAALVAALVGWLALRGSVELESAGALLPPTVSLSEAPPIVESAILDPTSGPAAPAREAALAAPAAPVLLPPKAPGKAGVVAGRATVNGGAPHGALRVVLDTDEERIVEQRRAAEPSAPASVRAAWATFTDASGAFSFVEVPADWCGTLSVSTCDGIVLGGQHTLVLEAPQPWVDLACTSPPVVRGRVLDAVTHAPVGGMPLELSLDSSPFPKHLETWSDGTFRASVASPDPSELAIGRLRESTERYEPGVVVERFTIHSAHGAKLGDLFCTRTRPVEVVVRDLAGAPLGGSTIGVEGFEPKAARCDALGRAVVHVFASIGATLRVEAEGYEARSVESASPAVVSLGRMVLRNRGRELVEMDPPEEDATPGVLEVELKRTVVPD